MFFNENGHKKWKYKYKYNYKYKIHVPTPKYKLNGNICHLPSASSAILVHCAGCEVQVFLTRNIQETAKKWLWTIDS